MNMGKIVKDYFFFILFALFVIGSFSFGFVPGKEMFTGFSRFFLEMIAFLPFMFLLVGMLDVWVPKEKIERHIGHASGISGIFWVILLATLQAGPLYGAFPVAYLLSKKGASPTNIFIYLGVFSSLKIPLLTFEIGFLGLKFSLLRTLISLPVFILIGFIMGKYVGRDFKVRAMRLETLKD